MRPFPSIRHAAAPVNPSRSDGRSRLIYNPRSRSGGVAGALQRCGALRGVELRETLGPADVTEQARLAASEGFDRLLVAGGDGTVHHAIRGLAGTDCALGILPTGTGNDLAHALGIPRNLGSAAESALRGGRRRIDLGSVGAVPFGGVAGLGFDGEVARYVNTLSRKARGPWVYPYAVLRTISSYRPPRVSIEFDDGRIEGPILLVAIANSPRYGAGMRIAPGAELDDGWLDLVVVRPLPLPALLALFPRVYRGAHVSHRAVTTHRVKRARIGTDRPMTVYADGEPVAETGDDALSIEIRPRALWIVAS